jgi:hypothetical protein
MTDFLNLLEFRLFGVARKVKPQARVGTASGEKIIAGSTRVDGTMTGRSSLALYAVESVSIC